MDFIPMIIVLAFILFDIVTGIAKAAKNKEIDSTVMREGLWSKAGSIFLEALAFATTFAHDLWDALPQDFSAVYIAVSLYIVMMELVSIIENICVLNPYLDCSKLATYFSFKQGDDDDDND